VTQPLFYLLTYLPPLPGLGEAPSLGFEEIAALVAAEGDPLARRLTAVVLLEDGFRKAVKTRFSGEDLDPATAAALPPVITEALTLDPSAIGEVEWLEGAWKAYFAHAAAEGAACGSAALRDWAGWEVTLREELAGFRCRHEEEGPGAVEHPALLEAWDAALDPMLGEKILDEARWTFLDGLAGRYSFSHDEFVAYLLKLRLLTRYQTLDRARGLQLLQEVATP